MKESGHLDPPMFMKQKFLTGFFSARKEKPIGGNKPKKGSEI